MYPDTHTLMRASRIEERHAYCVGNRITWPSLSVLGPQVAAKRPSEGSKICAEYFQVGSKPSEPIRQPQ